MEIQKKIIEIKNSIPENVTLVAVSKTKPVEDLQAAYDAGQRIFGENKIQEMVSKFDVLPKDIQWHMIGHLQSNKVKYMAHFVDLIHGIDKFKTLKEIVNADLLMPPKTTYIEPKLRSALTIYEF